MPRGKLSPLETKALDAFAAAVRTRFGSRAASIILFGSRARGEGRNDSDLDVLVLVEGLTAAERGETQDLAFDVGHEARLVLSPLVCDVARWRSDLPLGRAIQGEGVVL